MDYYLGIDCGGTFIKAIIVTQNGTVVASTKKYWSNKFTSRLC